MFDPSGLNDSYDDEHYGIPSGSSDYATLQAKISKMEKLVRALDDFHDQTHPLDLNHQNQVVSLRDAVMSLYEQTPPFQGSAANNLFNLLLQYLDKEQAFTGSVGDTSPQLASATTLCQNTANSIDQELQALYIDASQYAYTLDKDRNVPEWLRPLDRLANRNYPPDSILDANCVLPPSTVQRVSTMETDEWQWGNQMDSLGGQPPSQLPPEPTEPVKFAAPPLTRQQRGLVNDVIQYLTANGVAVNQDDVENLARLGYDRKTIIQILLAGIPTTLPPATINAQLMDLQSRIDESQRPFTLPEKHIAYLLSSEGHIVVALPEVSGQRNADALVDGSLVEFKSLKPTGKATSSTVKSVVAASIEGNGQARNIVIDARGSGLSREEAERAFARLKKITGGKIDSIRIIGDGFDVTSTDFN